MHLSIRDEIRNALVFCSEVDASKKTVHATSVALVDTRRNATLQKLLSEGAVFQAAFSEAGTRRKPSEVALR